MKIEHPQQQQHQLVRPTTDDRLVRVCVYVCTLQFICNHCSAVCYHMCTNYAMCVSTLLNGRTISRGPGPRTHHHFSSCTARHGSRTCWLSARRCAQQVHFAHRYCVESFRKKRHAAQKKKYVHIFVRTRRRYTHTHTNAHKENDWCIIIPVCI